MTYKSISSFQPGVVVVDPVTNLTVVATSKEVRSMLTRLIDFLKTRQITAVFTSLTVTGALVEASEAAISSLMDTWLMLESIKSGGERNRTLYIMKSRGMEHSNQIREFVLTPEGLRLLDVYLGSEGVLTGSARLSQEGREKAAETARRQEMAYNRRELEHKRQIFEAHMAMLRAEFEAEEERTSQTISASELLDGKLLEDRALMGRSRKADPALEKKGGRARAARSAEHAGD